MNAHVAVEPSLISALAKALPELESAKKNKPNPAFKSKYADLAAMIQALEPITAHGLWYRQHVHESEAGVMVETFYIHESGEQLSAGCFFVPASKKDAQGFGSALTYARRYALQTAFGLAVEDDDGNAASGPAARNGAGRDTTGDRQMSPTGPASEKQPAHSKLKSEIRTFVHDMEGCGDWDTWVALRDSKEGKSVIDGCKNNLPDWWHGWPEQPDGFIPLSRRIEILEGNLANQIADYARV